MNIWMLCAGEKQLQPIQTEPWRVVEAQHILSVRDLVDTPEEHDILEELIEQTKPYVAKDKDYLIFTPFRYPPLKYGSRFGRTFEPSLWYGSFELETAFAEVAYYRLMFLNDTTAQLGYIEVLLTAFTALLDTKKGIDLTVAPFNQYRAQISAKDTYAYSQVLGASMRSAQVQAFLYFSARTKSARKNIAAFTPDVFKKKDKHFAFNQQTWQCIANKHIVEFTRSEIAGRKRCSFTAEQFTELTPEMAAMF
ncbi:RES family NAD+ phosphorylase [Legionella septentrionalis]|uniref:RES family NAD+ phosphorylase n=1 Tax=Legionella septentrionalis TaxID=2498109 RepID=UPI000F8E8778|nr:RES family NAD+ phosphorylase [Legionella septentrionalis]RUQ97983.1 RES domain-containing protein [Legionella septentrionalis]